MKEQKKKLKKKRQKQKEEEKRKKKKKSLLTNKAPLPIGPYSQGIEYGNLIFVSGQIGIDPETGNLKEGIEEQTKQALENIKNILESYNLSMENVLKVTIFLKNIEDFQKVNEIYSSYFKEPFPARSTVFVKELPKGALVEIEVIAYK